MNTKRNCLHERCLPIVYSDSGSSFEDMLDKDNSALLNVKHGQCLAIEMLKISKACLSQSRKIFEKRNNAHNVLQPLESLRPKVHRVSHVQESISYFGPKIWDMIPVVEIKKLNDNQYFQKRT